MKLFSELKELARQLKPWKGRWALCGGVAASIYRDKARFTLDIDIAVVDDPRHSARALAEEVLKRLGHKPSLGFVPDPKGSGTQKMALILSREKSTSQFSGIDFLLPVFPWVPDAVERAQGNLIDYGFAKLATVTVEDLIIAKALAIRSNPTRFQDKDDILSILHCQKVDRDYLLRQSKRLALPLPRWLKELLR